MKDWLIEILRVNVGYDIISLMVKNKKAVDRVKALRAKGKSFREIARLMRREVKTIYRWYKYGLDAEPLAVSNVESV